MVTFALPGDGDDHVGDAPNGTPRPRTPLPFAKRTFSASSFGSNPPRRYGTPHAAPARKLSSLRDEVPSNSNSIVTARNIFRASTFGDSPPTGAFSPNLPQSTMKVFAPGATPEPTRVQRQSTAQATPRGMAARVADKELFPMRISSPPPELTGEVLAEKIPKEWNSKGSIYADQFLAHLCPPDLDEEQRRQFFCILDLRRLKYAANEIFSKKDWKLNVINFAKEFEKSRSIILLRYGLYEFQNVKPSREVLKRWRREHGLPEPEDEDVEPTPSKTAAKKRKADDELSRDPAATSGSVIKGKRRVMDRDAEQERQEPAMATPAPIKNKRKASVGEEHQSRMLKATPSSAKSFEKIASKPAAAPQGLDNPASAKTTPVAAKKYGSSSLARSVFTNLKSTGTQNAPAGNNIFGYLSDASSAKNSGVDADAENESETGSEGDESPKAGQSDEPSVAASGAGETGSQAGPGLVGKKPGAPTSGFGTGVLSNPNTRESTLGRSLFDRITKGSDGQPVRAEKADAAVPEKPAAPVDQTWNPTTPIKFAQSAPAAQESGLFGGPTSTPAGPVFAPKSTATPNMFGAAKHDTPPAKEPSAGASADEGAKDGGESDKENESQPPKKSVFEPKAPAAPPAFGSLSQPKPASVEAPKQTEAPKPSAPLFDPTKTDSKPEASTASMSGTLNKTSDKASATQSSLFGAKPAEARKPAEPEGPKAPSLFGGLSTSATFGNTTTTTGPLFGAKPATNAGSGLASGASAPSAPLFGGPSALGSGSTAAKTYAAPATTQAPSQPTFSFGSAFNGGPKPISEAPPSKPLFGSTQSPPSRTATGGMFGGSPMRQDEPSYAKKACTGGSNAGSARPIFSFGNSQAVTSAPSTSAFGGPSAPVANESVNAAVSFGAGSSSNPESGGFNFNFNGGSSGAPFNNPFAKSGPGTSTGVTFNFGAASSGPAGGSSTPFQFGGASGNTSAPAFGGAPAPGAAPVFNFTSAPLQPPQGPGAVFGSNQAAPAFGSLQPPAGGSSTTGTNSPLNVGGGSSLATTPAVGTPESSNQADGTNGGDNDEGEKQEQISLTDGVDADEEMLHEVRAKALKYVPPGDKSDSDDREKSKSSWSTRGVGPLRLLKHKETGVVRLLLRAEPRGHVVLNRAVLPSVTYKADEKYVKVATSNEEGDGLETWMIQVKTKDSAKALAEVLEKNKSSNKE